MPTSPTTLERPVAAIDPRIRARRIEVRRGMGRRRLQRLVDVGLLLAVVLGFALAVRSPLLDVDEVQVHGADHTAPELVRETAGVDRGEQLMDVDLHAVGERVAELPWVHEVRVSRGLDGRVVLDITERTAIAVVGEGDGAVLVDADGQAVAPASADPELAASVVHVTGGPSALRPGETLPPGSDDLLAFATRLAAVPGVAIQLHLGDDVVGTLTDLGIDVRFGDASRLDAKVASLRTMLEQVDLTCADVIDLRSPGSPVLTREEGCS